MTEALSKLEGNFLTEGEKKVIHWMLFNIILDDAMLEAFLLGKHLQKDRSSMWAGL